MSEETPHAPCPVCDTELVSEEGQRGVCPKCGECVAHPRDGVVVRDENAKGVEPHDVTVEITVREYASDKGRARTAAVDNVDRLLNGGRYTYQYSDNEYSIGGVADE
jgi:hypothetical protein